MDERLPNDIPPVQNLFDNVPARRADELVEKLAGSEDVRIERILSHGHASPGGFWYDQSQHEFVLLLRGAARLRFEGENSPIELKPGDYLTIPARCRHRVECTTPDEPTVWLAVHYTG